MYEVICYFNVLIITCVEHILVSNYFNKQVEILSCHLTMIKGAAMS